MNATIFLVEQLNAKNWNKTNFTKRFMPPSNPTALSLEPKTSRRVPGERRLAPLSPGRRNPPSGCRPRPRGAGLASGGGSLYWRPPRPGYRSERVFAAVAGLRTRHYWVDVVPVGENDSGCSSQPPPAQIVALSASGRSQQAQRPRPVSTPCEPRGAPGAAPRVPPPEAPRVPHRSSAQSSCQLDGDSGEWFCFEGALQVAAWVFSGVGFFPCVSEHAFTSFAFAMQQRSFSISENCVCRAAYLKLCRVKGAF